MLKFENFFRIIIVLLLLITFFTSVSSADLAVTKTPDKLNANTNDIITFTITIENKDNGSYSNIVITNPHNLAFEFINCSDEQNWDLGNDSDGYPAHWMYSGSLNSGKSISIDLTYKVTGLNIGELKDAVDVAVGINSTYISDNPITVTDVQLVGLNTVDKPKEEVLVGDEINFKIDIMNDGTSDATGITFTGDDIGGLVLKDETENWMKSGWKKNGKSWVYDDTVAPTNSANQLSITYTVDNSVQDNTPVMMTAGLTSKEQTTPTEVKSDEVILKNPTPPPKLSTSSGNGVSNRNYGIANVKERKIESENEDKNEEKNDNSMSGMGKDGPDNNIKIEITDPYALIKKAASVIGLFLLLAATVLLINARKENWQ